MPLACEKDEEFMEGGAQVYPPWRATPWVRARGS